MFHGKKNIIQMFCSFKPSKKTLSFIKILLVLINKAQRHRVKFKIHRISKGKKVNKLGEVIGSTLS